MIIINVFGGLGNQMMGMAFGKALSEEFQEPWYINLWWTGLHTRIMNLKHRLKGEKTENYKVRLSYLSCVQKENKLSWWKSIWYGIQFEFIYLMELTIKKESNFHGQDGMDRLNEKGLYGTFDFLTYYKHKPTKKKVKYVVGCPHSAKYFGNVENQIKKEFLVSVEPDMKNQRMLEEIQNCNAVCVHIRRGDYVRNQIYSSLNVCTGEYYRGAIHYFADHLSSPVFYIFSNNTEEIAWIKKNYHFPEKYKFVYVDLNNPDYEELRLMYSCKHFIISNSSFSWWAAYLSANREKQVIAPPVWRVDYEKPLDVFPENIIFINTEGQLFNTKG